MVERLPCIPATPAASRKTQLIFRPEPDAGIPELIFAEPDWSETKKTRRLPLFLMKRVKVRVESHQPRSCIECRPTERDRVSCSSRHGPRFQSSICSIRRFVGHRPCAPLSAPK